MRYGFIYETTNLLNGMRYIGKHKRTQSIKDTDDSWYLGSGLHLVRAIEKYGRENFSRKIIEECDSEEELQEKERYYIDLYDAVNSPNYYNICRDANPPKCNKGIVRPDTWKINISNTLKGHTPWNKGIGMTEEQCEKLSESLKGRAAWNKGKDTPEEVRKKQSESHKGSKVDHYSRDYHCICKYCQRVFIAHNPRCNKCERCR